MQNVNTFLQFIITVIVLLGTLFTVYKVLWPKIKINIHSFYHCIGQNGELLSVLKLRVDASCDLVVEDLAVCCLQGERSRWVKRFALRWKKFFPEIKDADGNLSHYKLTRAIDPELVAHGIKTGINEYYIALKSVEPFTSDDIDSWVFTFKTRSPSMFFPRFLTFRTSIVPVEQLDDKDLYFDDSFIEQT